jgi:solute carrier family 35 protein E1
MAFILMIPIWIFSDLPIFLSLSPASTKGHPIAAHPHSIPTYFFLNGTAHFAQSILAFVLLSSTSPVTYSIASLIKRVAVICIAIVWFKQHTHPVQALGIALAFVGLWMYNSAKGDGSVERGEKKRSRLERAAEGVLPSTMEDVREATTVPLPTNAPSVAETTGTVVATAYSRPRAQTSTSPPTHAHHPSRHLHINTTHLPAKLELNSLPKNSYPSPPPSLDSPTETAVPLGFAPMPAQT